MREVYIAAPCRTAVGSFQGGLKSKTAVELGVVVIQETLRRAGISGSKVDQVILGNVLQAGQGQNPARQAAIGAGLPAEVPAMTLNKVCGSGLTSVYIAAMLVRAGEADCVVAGGMESMSNAPYYLPKIRSGARMGNAEVVDGMVHDGLWDAFGDYHMGITAENIAETYGISREEQDAFSCSSQQKAAKAQADGRFLGEIVPVEIIGRKGEHVNFDKDEYIRTDTSCEQMAKLRPAFKKDGTVTAANASGINDGAAAMLVVSEDFVRANHLEPAARYVAGASIGVEPSLMGLGPIPSVKKALQKAGLQVSDIDLFEANEAFAVQALAVAKDLGIYEDRLNVNGGAIAIGHPVGASGARIAVTLLHEMEKRQSRYGLSTLCIGGGMGEAAVFERDSLCGGAAG